MTRGAYIEQMLRDVYGEQPNDDAALTENLVNIWVNEGIGIAIKQSWKESAALEGITYLNNAFYLTITGLAVTAVNQVDLVYKMTLPQIPYSLGRNEGIASLRLADSSGNTSYDTVPLSTNQVAYAYQMRAIPNKLLYWNESQFLYIRSAVPLFKMTGTVRMVAASEDASDLDSVLNLPDDVLAICTQYVTKMLMAQRQQAKMQTVNDGQPD